MKILALETSAKAVSASLWEMYSKKQRSFLVLFPNLTQYIIF